jgi:hypothetical protein
MALSILDGNQSATTLSTILSSGQHITAHTVVSLGTQAITDMRSAVSGSVVSISNFPASQVISGTVTANPTGTQTITGSVTANVPVLDQQIRDGILLFNQTEGNIGVAVNYAEPITGSVTIGAGTAQIGSVTASISGTPSVTGSISVLNFPASQSVTFGLVGGTVTANNFTLTNVLQYDGSHYFLKVGGVATTGGTSFPVYVAGTVTIGSALPAGTNRIGVVTIGGGTVTIGAGTSQIGSVTAFVSDLANVTEAVDEAINQSVIAIHIKDLAGNVLGTSVSPMLISGTVTANPTGTQTIAGSVTLGAGTAQIGSVTASISNSVVTFYPLQGTIVTNSNFTSTTASTTLVSAVAGREVLTVFSEGPGQLFISPGATCTSASYQVRLSPGDYWECPSGQLSLAHTAVFSTAGTARVTEVS